jgi:hypothetical protein
LHRTFRDSWPHRGARRLWAGGAEFTSQRFNQSSAGANEVVKHSTSTERGRKKVGESLCSQAFGVSQFKKDS